jgi:hypothetical protein
MAISSRMQVSRASARPFTAAAPRVLSRSKHVVRAMQQQQDVSSATAVGGSAAVSKRALLSAAAATAAAASLVTPR